MSARKRFLLFVLPEESMISAACAWVSGLGPAPQGPGALARLAALGKVLKAVRRKAAAETLPASCATQAALDLPSESEISAACAWVSGLGPGPGPEALARLAALGEVLKAVRRKAAAEALLASCAAQAALGLPLEIEMLGPG